MTCVRYDFIVCISYAGRDIPRTVSRALTKVLLHRLLMQRSIAHGLGEGLIPSQEASLPPLVEGPIKGEVLLHISSLQLADGSELGRTLQAGAPPMLSM